MPKLSDDLNIPKLCEQMQKARMAMKRPREEVREMARQVAAAHYSEEGAQNEVYVNLLSIYQAVIGRALIPKNPRVMLATFRRSMKPAVNAMETWCNKQIEHIKLARTLRRIVTNGLYSIGIAKVSLATPAMSAGAGWNLRAGEVMVSNIDLDDRVPDVHARDESEYSFEAHRYRVPFAAVADSKLYSKWVRARITPSYDPIINLEGDERISAIARTYYATDTEEYEPMLDLWEVYLPRHRAVVTLAEDQLTGPSAESTRGEPLKIQSWIGPDRGPFLHLGFQTIPGNFLPKGPMQDQIGVHLAHNRCVRKLVRTIDRMKEVTLVQGGADKDGKAVMDANDGDMIGVSNPQAVANMAYGGQNAQTLVGLAETLKNWHSYIGGNIELLGGRSPQSRTATQDKMLEEQASAGVADLQDQTTDFTSDLLRNVCWFWWHDPTKIMEVKHNLPALPGMTTRLRVHPGGSGKRLSRDGEMPDVSVDPYSLQRSTPQSKMATLNQIVQGIITPLMQILVQSGKTFDVDAYLQKAAKYLDQPDLYDLITIQEPPEQDQSPGLSDKPQMPVSTNREYTRHNVSQRTQQSDSQNLISQMLGHKIGGTNNANGAMNGVGR